MADDLVLNKIEGAGIVNTANQTRFVQTGSINNIDTTTVTAVELLWRALQILRNNGYTVSNPITVLAGHTGVSLQRIEVVGYTDNGVNIALFWETPSFGVTSIYTIQKSTVLTPYQTDLLPGTRKPLRINDTVVSSSYDSSGSASTDTYTVQGDNVLFTFLKPLETINVIALTFGAPKYVGNRVGNVNDANWPASTYSFPTFGGHDPTNEQKGPGYWLLTEWTTREERYAGYYSLNASAVSRVDEDWSYTGLLTNRATGKRIAMANETATLAAMNPLPYSFGIIYNAGGMIRVGPYRTTNFQTLFGF